MWAVCGSPPGRSTRHLILKTCLHEGAPVSPDCAKYIIRADVIFERSGTHKETQIDRDAFVLLQKAEATESQPVIHTSGADEGMAA